MIKAIPPARTVLEQLEFKGMTREQFAYKVGLTRSELREFIRGNMTINKPFAQKIEQVLGVPAQFWLNLEMIYRKKLEKNA